MTYKYGWTPPEKIVKRPPLDVRVRTAIQKVRDGLAESKKDQSDLAFVRALLTCAEVAVQEQRSDRGASYVKDAATHLFGWGQKKTEVHDLVEDL